MDLIDAVKNGNIKRVRELLDSGADPNITDNNLGDTALISACRGSAWRPGGNQPRIDIVELLLDHGADPNIRGYIGSTALIYASFRSRADIVRLLLRRGANPNIKRYTDGVTSLIMASGKGHIDIVRLLLDNGADPNIREDNGDTALMAAESEGHGDTARVIRNHIDLQRTRQNLALATSFMSRDTPLQNLDYDGITQLMSRARKYNPSVKMRIRDERSRDPLTKSKQRLASMRAMHSREGPIGSVRYDPSIMEGIGKHLTSMRPDAGVQRRMIEDKQMGSGKRSSKKRRKRKYYTRRRF